ncbi:coth-domain-containing protein [Neocallimastix sp. 'constans']
MISSIYVHCTFGDISFISKGQRAELFEIMDNEVPTFRITLPENEYINLKRISNNNIPLESINDNIKQIIDLLNQQNFNYLFQKKDLSELFPELAINENGYLNLNENDFMISYEDYINIEQINLEEFEILFKILNENKNLNLIKVFHVLSQYRSYLMNDDLLEVIDNFENHLMIDKDENFTIIKEEYIIEIKTEISYINNLNFKETFPEINFSELFPELPIKEDGHPNIDFRNYILPTEEYENLKLTFEDDSELIFNIYNTNKYLNINKVLYFLSTSNVEFTENDLLKNKLYEFKSQVMMDDNGNFTYIKEDYIRNIKEIINSINEQNFIEIFPRCNFTELLPELPILENGHPNIDFKIYIIPSEEIEKLESMFKYDEIIFNIFNNNKSLNLVKVFYVLSRLDDSLINIESDFWYNLDEFKSSTMIDDNGNFTFLQPHIKFIKEIIETINEQNFIEIFPGYNFTELLPELPIQENGHPNIDFRNYLISEDEYNNLETKYDNNFEYFLFDIFNNNEYLNLVKVLNTLSKLDNININTINIDNRNYSTFSEYLELFGDNNVSMNENNEYIFNNKYYNTENDTNNNDKTISNININQNERDEFKTKNGTLTVHINNQEISFNKITFSLGGQSSRTYSKPGFNLKIRGGKELFGRRQFKLRSDSSEPSYMRTKLMCDIHNKLGLPSISANYIKLYINDEFMGLYILTDAYKESWIEYVYGEKDTTNLYKCEYCDLLYDTKNGFENENKEASDNQELYEFLKAMTKAKSSVDVESIFDLDQFYKEIAIEYLSSSWDHIKDRHNYYVYKNPQNNKWIYLIHDFDLDLCAYYYQLSECINYDFKNFSRISIVNKLVSNNIEHFKEILKEIVIKVFNPATLFPRIDEIKSFIRPYVQLDKTLNDNGEYPGRLNKNDNRFYTMEQWEASTEFEESLVGLKKFILLRYRYVCKKFNIECDPMYLDENMNMNLTITETESLYPTETETSSFLIPTSTFDFINIEATTTSIEDTILPISTSIFDSNIDETITSSVLDFSNTEITTSIEDTILPTTISVLPTTNSILPTSNSQFNEATGTLPPISQTTVTFKCLSEFLGYPCCSSELTTVYAEDEYGEWSYDFTKNEWCGLTKFEDSSNQDHSGECWSEILGYPCCKGCKIYETDSDGSWGYEFNQWCGIISSRCQKE